MMRGKFFTNSENGSVTLSFFRGLNVSSVTSLPVQTNILYNDCVNVMKEVIFAKGKINELVGNQ